MPHSTTSDSRLPRRQFLKTTGQALAGLVVGGTALTACGSDPTTGATPTTTAKKYSNELRILQRAGFVPGYEDSFKQLSAEWGKQNSVNVTVEFINLNDLQARVTLATKGDAGPDIMHLDSTWPWFYQAACVDLSKEYNTLNTQLGGFYDLAATTAIVNNVPRAIPFCISPGVWVYRKSWLTQAGADKFPDKWEDFYRLGKQLKTQQHPVGVSLDHSLGDATGMWYSFLWSFGGREVEKDGKTVAINSPETLAAVEAAVAFYRDCLSAENLTWDDSSNNKAFLGEQISATLNSPSIYLTAKKENRSFLADLGHALYPQGPAGRFTYQSPFHNAVMRYSKNQDAAKDFLVWLMQPEQFNRVLTACGGNYVGATPAYDNNPLFKADPQLALCQEAVKSGKNIGYPGPPSLGAGQSQSQFVIVDMFSKAARGLDPKTAVSEAENQLRQIYSPAK